MSRDLYNYGSGHRTRFLISSSNYPPLEPKPPPRDRFSFSTESESDEFSFTESRTPSELPVCRVNAERGLNQSVCEEWTSECRPYLFYIVSCRPCKSSHPSALRVEPRRRPLRLHYALGRLPAPGFLIFFLRLAKGRY